MRDVECETILQVVTKFDSGPGTQTMATIECVQLTDDPKT
jgi:hypothetical protein